MEKSEKSGKIGENRGKLDEKAERANALQSQFSAKREGIQKKLKEKKRKNTPVTTVYEKKWGKWVEIRGKNQ